MVLVKLIPWQNLTTRQIAAIVMTGFVVRFNGLVVEVWAK